MSIPALLDLLDADTLLQLGDALGLSLPADAPEEGLRRAIAEADAATLASLLAALSRDALKALCKDLLLEAAGAGKSPLVRALTAHFTQDAASTARTVSLEVFPRQPRLAWQGMDQREAVTSVPAQVVEIVRPGRARALEQDATKKEAPGGLFDVNVREVGHRVATEDHPNRIIWTNDNLVALQTLLAERDATTKDYRYRGKVDLVYIDPPFMVNSDFRADNAITIDLDEKEGIEATKEPSLVETIAYRDTWRNGLDSFLVMLRRRLELLKELLAPTGSIYVHLDWHAVHYVKVMMDEVFGYENFQSEIIWKRTTSHADAKGFNAIHDTILSYSMSDATRYWQPTLSPHSTDYIKSHYNRIDERTGRRYRLNDLRSPAPRPNMIYDWNGYKPHKNGWSISREVMAEFDRQGLIYYPPNGERLAFKKYLDDDGVAVMSIWGDLFPVNSQAIERLGYPTQKPVALLERIISASCPPGGLVLDCFMGSGTTCEAAERLGRRWIGIDAGKYATHLARKRLILLHGQPRAPEKPQFSYEECEHCGNIDRKEKKTRSPLRYDVRPFTMENMGVYQRAEAWQGFQQNRSVYRDEMVRVYGGEPADAHPLLHGTKAGAWVHIGPLDGPISSHQAWRIAEAAEGTDLKKVIVLSADFDTLTSTDRDEIKRDRGVSIDVKVIPASAIDEVRRRIKDKGNTGATVIESMAIPAFYAPLSIRLVTATEGRLVRLKLERCEVDIESFMASQRPALVDPQNAKTAAAKKRAVDEQAKWGAREKLLLAWLDKATSWQSFVDFWSVDSNYGARVGEDNKPIFQTDWQSFRERGAKAGGLTFAAEVRYEKGGKYRMAARVTDVFGNDGIATVEVTVK